MDGDTEMSLPADPIEEQVQDWLLNTKGGQAYGRHFEYWSTEIVSESHLDTIRILQGFLSVVGLNKDPKQNRDLELPPDVADAIYGPRFQKVLSDDNVLVKLLISCNAVNFILNSYTNAEEHPPMTTTNDINKQARLLDSAFSQPFEGKGVEWVEKALEGYEKLCKKWNNRHFGKTIPIVQSSGMGKSRTMAELSKKRYLLTICFRNIKQTRFDPGQGWPPHDSPACQFFVEENLKDENSRFYGEELAGVFLGALLDVAADTLESSSTPEEFAKMWGISDPTHIESSERHKRFQQVYEKAKETLRDQSIQLEQDRTAHGIETKPTNPNNNKFMETSIDGSGSVIRESTSQESNKSIGSTVSNSWVDQIHDRYVKVPANRIEAICRRRNAPDFLLAVDECTALNLDRNDSPSQVPSKHMSLFCLQRTLEACRKISMWTFLLDTTSSIRLLVPATGDLAPSARLVSSLVPLPPFPYMAYDIFAPNNAAKEMTPERVLYVNYLQSYGRPLWKSIPPADCLESACEKLLCSTVFDPLDQLEVFAVFSARLLLDLGTDAAANRLAQDAVRKHLRVLTGVLEHGILTTCAPSEPILALAASSILLRSKKHYQDAIQTLVKSIILQGTVLERGVQGELLARIILMAARDAALVASATSSPVIRQGSENDPVVETVSLDDFLNALLRSADNHLTGADPLSLWTKQFQLNFTHFIQLDASIHELSAEFLFKCWSRGAAIMCAFHQPIYDILLVTYNGRLDDTFDATKFGIVTIQVKLRTQAISSQLVEQLTCPAIVNEDGESWKPEHLAIVMDLGTQSSFQHGGYYEISRNVLDKPSKKQVALRMHYLGPAKEKERYVLNIRGHTQYAVMEADGLAPGLSSVFKSFHRNPLSEFQDLADSMVETLKQAQILDTE